MGLVNSIKKFFGPAPLYLRFDDLESGRAVVEGDIRTGDGGHLLSPLKGQACVGFVYAAAREVPGRSGQIAMRPLRHVEVFHRFALDMDGGCIDAVPYSRKTFSQAEHQSLSASGYAGFRAVEEIIPVRARVRLHGILSKKRDAWTLTYQRVVVVKAGGRTSKRKRRG